MLHAVSFKLCSVAVPGLLVIMELYVQCTQANAPSWGSALASEEMHHHAGNHRGVPCTTGQLCLNENNNNNKNQKSKIKKCL